MEKVLNSYWGVLLKPEFISNDSETLAIVLPGIGYTLDRVTLEYSSELMLEEGFDLLKIEYGFQVARKKFDVEKEFDIASKETLELIKSYDLDKYKKIIIVGKSIGTCVQNYINKNLSGYNIQNIYISPINKTIQMGMLEKSLVFTGGSDPLLSSENIEGLFNNKNLKVILFGGANHALNIKNNPIESLNIQIKIIDAIKFFINK